MKIIITIFLSALLTGCSAPIHKISLHSNPSIMTEDQLSVIDNRLDKQVYISGISVSGTHIYVFEVEPEIEKVINGFIELSLEGHTPKSRVIVSIEEIDIKNKVGFAKADSLSCIFESNVHFGENQIKVIKTLSLNNENMSSFITTAGKIIINQCVKDHGRDIASFIIKMDNKKLQ